MVQIAVSRYASIGFVIVLVACNIILGMALYRSYYSYALDDCQGLNQRYVCASMSQSSSRTEIVPTPTPNPGDTQPECKPCPETKPAPDTENHCECKQDAPGDDGDGKHTTPCPACEVQKCDEKIVPEHGAIVSTGPPAYVVDLFIVHFLPLDTSMHRIVQQQPNPYVRLHVFVISQANDSICYKHPLTGTLKCMPRLHATPRAMSMLMGRSPVPLQVCFDYLQSFKMFEPTSDFTMVMEDDCSLCDQSFGTGRLSSVLQFMKENKATHVIVGPGACGQTFWSEQLKNSYAAYLEEMIVTQPRDQGVLRSTSGDETMKNWALANGGGYGYKYTLVRHHNGRSMTWSDAYTIERDRHLSQCGEIQSFFPPRYDAENCWNVSFSPCMLNTFNRTKYAEDVGHNPYRYDITTSQYVLGTLATERYVIEYGRTSPYTEINIGSNNVGSALSAVMPMGFNIVLGPAGADCNSACRSAGRTCYAGYDSAWMNDCSFLNSVFAFKPPVKCILPFLWYGAFVDERQLWIGTFAGSRHAHIDCDTPNINRNFRFVCTCKA